MGGLAAAVVERVEAAGLRWVSLGRGHGTALRGILWRGEPWEGGEKLVQVEVGRGLRAVGVYLAQNDERTVLGLHLGWSLYLSRDTRYPLPKGWRERLYEAKACAIEGDVVFSLHAGDPDAWARRGFGAQVRAWASGEQRDLAARLDLTELLFGERTNTRRTLAEGDVELVLPEGSYPVRLRVERIERTRPRWPWAVGPLGESLTILNMEVAGWPDGDARGIPTVTRKGDDAIYAMSALLQFREDYSYDQAQRPHDEHPRELIHLALAQLQRRFLLERLKNGGPNALRPEAA